MFSISQNDVNTLKDEVHFFQAERSILIPSVEDYLPDTVPVSFSIRIYTHTSLYPAAFTSYH